MRLSSKKFLVVALAVHFADANAAASANPLDLSIEELMNVVVTSVAKKNQKLTETAAAVHIINAEDIRRSGATSIPEVLRLAPGVQVSALGNNKWAVSIRGQADRYSNKLLVLVDGRSVYTPRFSGVIWEALDIPLENIDRIEIMRGPGASLWGSNAVNGVINIITRSPFDVTGLEVTASAGTERKQYGFARYGVRLSDNMAFSAYVKQHEYGPSQLVNGDEGIDYWNSQSEGFNFERLLEHGSIQIQGSHYSTDAGDEFTVYSIPPAITQAQSEQDINGTHLLARWQQKDQSGNDRSLLLYTNQYDSEHVALLEKRRNVGAEFQQTYNFDKHQINAGLYYLKTSDTIENTPTISVVNRQETSTIYSVFVEDDITLQPGRWRLTLGARLEHNDITEFNVQPNVRLLWTPTEQDSIWAAVSRAVRTPSRSERDMITNLAIDYSQGIPVVQQLVTDNKENEILAAFDFGWRHQFNQALGADLNLFYFRYTNMRGTAAPVITFEPSGYLLAQIVSNNTYGNNAYGGELALDWAPVENWTLTANYSWLDMRDLTSAEFGLVLNDALGTSPKQQFSLRSTWDISPALQFDAWLKHVGRIPLYDIPAFTTLDLRLGFEPLANVQINVVGQNLLDSSHPEFSSLFRSGPLTEIERSAYISLHWQF